MRATLPTLSMRKLGSEREYEMRVTVPPVAFGEGAAGEVYRIDRVFRRSEDVQRFLKHEVGVR
jgi:hypothetical protein